MSQEKILEEALRNMLHKIAARHMWMAIPEELEDYLVSYVADTIEPEFLDERPEGCLCNILTEIAWAYHAGWINIKDPDPYSQMEEHFELPDLEVVGPHGAWVKITDCGGCAPFYEADEKSTERMLSECQQYGHYYLR